MVPYTTNDLLPYIRQAAAVISEESGTNGHAATVGLTLGKAVIVGAAGAVQRLKDGAMVSVDCARGVVQTLPSKRAKSASGFAGGAFFFIGGPQNRNGSGRYGEPSLARVSLSRRNTGN